MALLGLLPDCARKVSKPCDLPGLFRVKLVENGRVILAYLCPICVAELPDLMKEVAAVREEDRVKGLLSGPTETEPSGEDPLE